MIQYNKDLGRVSVVAEGAWNNNKEYDKLSIVYNKCDKFAYISRKTVPVGVDIENREYWQPINVNGYADNNFINLTTTDENNNLTAYENVVEAATSVNVYNRRVGAVMSFYNINSERLDRQAEFELWQFNSTDVNNWTKESAWQNIYYNWNVFVGWYIGLDSLKNHIANPTVGQYAYVGSTLNDAVLVQCRTNNVWTLTNTKIRDYISVKVEGNVTIGSNGHWYCDGNDTGIPATPSVDEELDNIVTQIKTINTTLNALHTEDARIEEKIDSNKETLDKKINDVVLNLQKQITSNDEDISDLQTKVKQNKDTIDSIAVSGGASVASAVTYDNTTSGLESENVQNAIDELVNNLGHYETNEEWLRLYLDKEGHILWGIRVDGSIEWSVGIPTPVQKKLNELISSDDTIKQTITELKEYTDQQLATKVDKEEGKSLIDNEVKDCFKIVENDEFIHCILDAEEHILFAIRRDTGKPYFPLNDMYHVEQNEEYVALWLDSADHILMGIRRDGVIVGEINACNVLKKVIASIQSDVAELQTIEPSLKELLNTFTFQENDEFLEVKKDAEGKILESITSDGSHYIHNAKSETIPTEFSHIDDPDGRMSIETDSDGKILGYRDKDGVKYEHEMNMNTLHVSNINLKDNSVNDIQSALIANGFNVKSPVDWSNSPFVYLPQKPTCALMNITGVKSMPSNKSQSFHAYAEIWDKNGNYFKKNVILTAQGNSSMAMHKKNFAVDFCEDEWIGDNTTSIKIGEWVSQDSFHFKAYYTDIFKMACPIGYKLFEKMVETKDFCKQRPYMDYFSQEYTESNSPSSDMSQNIDISARCFPDGFPVVVYLDNDFYGVFSWQLKKHRDNFHMNRNNELHIHLDGELGISQIWSGKILWSEFEIRNPKPKSSKWSLLCQDGSKYDGDNPKELMGIDSEYYEAGNTNCVKSAKVKETILSLSKYMTEIKVFEDAYNKAEENDKTSALEELKKQIESRFSIEWMIDYIILNNIIENADSTSKNWQWTTWGIIDNKVKWYVLPYDLDNSFGINSTKSFSFSMPQETAIGINTGTPVEYVWKYYRTELEERYINLRKLDVISYKTLFGLVLDWIKSIGYDNYVLEYKKWDESPCNRDSQINISWARTGTSYSTFDDTSTSYNSSRIYKEGDYVKINRVLYKSLKNENQDHNPITDTDWWNCVMVKPGTYKKGDTVFDGYSNFFEFKALNDIVVGEDMSGRPFVKFYNSYPREGGVHDSIYRISKWILKKIELMDNVFNYNK